MISEIFVKFVAFFLLGTVAVVLVLGIGTLFKGDKSKQKYSNKLSHQPLEFYAHRPPPP